MNNSMKRQWLIGLCVVTFLTIIASVLNNLPWLSHMGFSTLTLSIVIGMIIGNTFYPRIAPYCHDGINFSKNKILRIGIILYGFRLTLQQVGTAGWLSILADIIMLGSTFVLTYELARRWLKLDSDTAILIGAGSSICGAAAIMAAEPILKSTPAKVSVAIATVVIFGTIGMFLYPQMYAWNWWPITDTQYGVYIGSTVHEVAQVVAAGKSINDEVANLAVATKMIRVMMLAPVLLILAFWQNRKHAKGNNASNSKIAIPWFAFVFIGVVIINSFQFIPVYILQKIINLDTFLLSMAMTALGLTTSFKMIRSAGIKPLILGSIILIWLIVAGGLLQVLLANVFAI